MIDHIHEIAVTYSHSKRHVSLFDAAALLLQPMARDFDVSPKDLPIVT